MSRTGLWCCAAAETRPIITWADVRSGRGGEADALAVSGNGSVHRRERWADFHHEFISALREALTPQLRPRYAAIIEERIYVEHPANGSGPGPIIRPEVTLIGTGQRGAGSAATLVAAEPVTLTLPMPERVREPYLVIRNRESREVVTILQVLSPGNKRPGSDGRREYLLKREMTLLSAAHLVELDLLRGGERLPTLEPLPAADYYVFVSRAPQRPRVHVYHWPLRSPLPAIPIPLAEEDPEVRLNLQAVFTATYDRAGYDYSLDYRQSVEPPLADAKAQWAAERLQAASQPPAA